MANYLRGFSVKPYEINPLGEVRFTDGTLNDLIPNKRQCEAYGYTYDLGSGTCRLNQIRTDQIQESFQNSNITIAGNNNTADFGTEYSVISGTENRLRAGGRNSLVMGTYNTIETEINNATAIGHNGTAKSQSEFVIGGGKNKHTFVCGATTETIYTNKQMSIIELSGGTCNRDPVTLTVNGDGESYINVNNNSIVGYEIYLTRLELGGVSGTAGDYSYRSLRGSVQIDNAYSMTFSTLIDATIGEIGGVSGSATVIDTSTTDVKSFSIQVVDRIGVTNGWSAIMYVHEITSTNVNF